MARYRGPKQKIARRFGEPIFGPSKALERKP
ncbi:MAG: 30S ribosomal protein S4, partial [Rubrivirga sp.]